MSLSKDEQERVFRDVPQGSARDQVRRYRQTLMDAKKGRKPIYPEYKQED